MLKTYHVRTTFWTFNGATRRQQQQQQQQEQQQEQLQQQLQQQLYNNDSNYNKYYYSYNCQYKTLQLQLRLQLQIHCATLHLQTPHYTMPHYTTLPLIFRHRLVRHHWFKSNEIIVTVPNSTKSFPAPCRDVSKVLKYHCQMVRFLWPDCECHFSVPVSSSRFNGLNFYTVHTCFCSQPIEVRCE